MEAWKNAVGRTEEYGEAEGEEVRRVANAGEDVTRDLEVLSADLDDGFRVEKLGYETRYWEMLSRIERKWMSKPAHSYRIEHLQTSGHNEHRQWVAPCNLAYFVSSKEE